MLSEPYDTERLIPLLQAGDTPSNGFGYINPVRWGELGAQLKANGLLPDSADLNAGYNPKRRIQPDLPGSGQWLLSRLVTRSTSSWR